MAKNNGSELDDKELGRNKRKTRIRLIVLISLMVAIGIVSMSIGLYFGLKKEEGKMPETVPTPAEIPDVKETIVDSSKITSTPPVEEVTAEAKIEEQPEEEEEDEDENVLYRYPADTKYNVEVLKHVSTNTKEAVKATEDSFGIKELAEIFKEGKEPALFQSEQWYAFLKCLMHPKPTYTNSLGRVAWLDSLFNSHRKAKRAARNVIFNNPEDQQHVIKEVTDKLLDVIHQDLIRNYDKMYEKRVLLLPDWRYSDKCAKYQKELDEYGKLVTPDFLMRPFHTKEELEKIYKLKMLENWIRVRSWLVIQSKIAHKYAKHGDTMPPHTLDDFKIRRPWLVHEMAKWGLIPSSKIDRVVHAKVLNTEDEHFKDDTISILE